jgi:sugar phosphate isomerase/epimerase
MTSGPTVGNRALLATCWTSAGDAAPDRGGEVSPVDLRTRIETAAEVGWEGFGLLHADLAIARSTLGLPELRRILDGAGIEHVELEFLPWWWTSGERRRISDRSVDPARFHADFDALATRAGVAGTRVAVAGPGSRRPGPRRRGRAASPVRQRAVRCHSAPCRPGAAGARASTRPAGRVSRSW